jgi:foldase protein PrsA
MESSESTSTAPAKGWKKYFTRNTNIAIVVVVVIIVGVLLYVGRGLVFAATVNGSPITRYSVMKAAEKQDGAQILDSLITQKLVEQELDKKGITVTQDEINAELQKITDQLTGQGMTLDQALQAQNLSKADLMKQITTQKRVEKLLAASTTVSDDEITKYISDNKLTAPASTTEAEFRSSVSDTIENQKFGDAAQTWVSGLRAAANIKTFANY